MMFPVPQWQAKSVSLAHPSVKIPPTKHVNAHDGSCKAAKSDWRWNKGCGIEKAVWICAVRMRRMAMKVLGVECVSLRRRRIAIKKFAGHVDGVNSTCVNSVGDVENCCDRIKETMKDNEQWRN
jgi:hypothetical protein